MDDISTIENINEHAVLQLLKERFKNDKIYTFAGETLIKIAPINDVKCHSIETNERYHLSKWREHPAHLFALADDAYQGSQAENQCIILRGQTGSGKTESANRILRHFVTTSCDSELQRKILQVPGVLQAFGNAKTTLNANASRFGRYTTLYFCEGKVVGVKTNEFFLERWRINCETDVETNFHIFYYVLAGLGLGERIADYRYLGNRKMFNSTNISNWQSKAEAVTNAMSSIGISSQEQTDINMLLLSILAIGNIAIQRSRVGEAAIDPGAVETLKNISDFLGLNSIDLEESICCCEVNVNGDKVQKRLTRDEAEDRRDSLACLIYQRLFTWIVYRMNFHLKPPASESLHREIGILDTPGFENISNNGFEQCFVNLTEEILLGLFSQTIFRVTEEQCRIEGVAWPSIDVPVNDYIADLFLMKPGGLLATIEEATLGENKGNEESFVKAITNNLKDNRFFEPGPAAMRHMFTVKHFMGQVSYDARGWLAKNKTTLPSATVLMLQNAENSLLSTMFKATISSRGTIANDRRNLSRARTDHPVPSSRTLTTTAYFKNSIQSILTKIENTNQHFICCIKPTNSNSEPVFEDQFVLTQLRWLGVVEAARVSSEGFSESIDHQQFIDRYGNLTEGAKSTNESPSAICRAILTKSLSTGWQIGQSKVFLKDRHLRILSQIPPQPIDNSQQHSADENSYSRSVYSMAQPVSPIIDETPGPQLTPSKNSYALVVPKGLRGNAKNPGGRLYPSLDNLETIFESDKSDSDFEQLEEDFMNTRRREMESCAYGKEGTRQAAIRWFKITQANALRQGQENVYYDWCHGIITRKESEELLSNKPRGCFLIRLGETRFGYSLSLKDDNRCRHYMIEQLVNAKYRVVGELKDHTSLYDLVNFYKKNKLANWNGVLTVPCGQRDGDCDYLELVLSTDDEEQLARLMNSARLEPSAPDYNSVGSNSGPRPEQSFPGPGILPPKMPTRSSRIYVNAPPSAGTDRPLLPPPRTAAAPGGSQSPRVRGRAEKR